MSERMTIGFIENYVGKQIIFWFYRYVNDRWVKCHTEAVYPPQREEVLSRLIDKSDLIPLGRGA